MSDRPDAPPAAARKRKMSKDQYGLWRSRCSCGWSGSPWEIRRESVREFDRHYCDDWQRIESEQSQ